MKTSYILPISLLALSASASPQVDSIISEITDAGGDVTSAIASVATSLATAITSGGDGVIDTITSAVASVATDGA